MVKNFLTNRNDKEPRALNSSNLEDKLNSQLKSRILNSQDYDQTEIHSIEALEHRLFPKNFLLKKDDNEQLRRLASLSRVAVKPPSEITSHRPLIGPLVVLFKKLTWPIIAFHMKDTLKALEDFCALSVANHAKLLVALEEMEKSKKS